MSEFKPCPFCGSESVSMSFSIANDTEKTRWHMVECHDCMANGPSFQSRGKAHNWWNERAIIKSDRMEGEK